MVTILAMVTTRAIAGPQLRSDMNDNDQTKWVPVDLHRQKFQDIFDGTNKARIYFTNSSTSTCSIRKPWFIWVPSLNEVPSPYDDDESGDMSHAGIVLHDSKWITKDSETQEKWKNEQNSLWYSNRH